MASGTQKFFGKLLGPEAAAAAEAESRAWKVRCGECGFEQSVWDMGGIRYKAAGEHRRRLRCTNCGKTSWHTVTRDPSVPVQQVSSWPIVRLVLGIVVVTLLVVAAILLIAFKATGIL